MTPTHILQQEARERRAALGLPPEELWSVVDAEPLQNISKSPLDKLRGRQKNRWRDIKKGKLC